MLNPLAGTAEDHALHGVDNLVSLLSHHAANHGGDRAVAFLPDGIREEASLSYAALELEARSIAAWLTAQGLAGQRALLLFPSGLEFVTTFLGCLYAGVIAVPVNPPRLNRKADRLRSVVENSQAAVVLTTARMRDRVRPVLADSGLPLLRLAAVDERTRGMEVEWTPPEIDGDSLAFLQYTSGSTSVPKGVMVSHRNLLANHRMIQVAFGLTKHTRILTWLPLYHDMGLIGNVLQALYLGAECLIVPSEVVLMKPVRWLEAISQHRVTSSGAPNFAYELCIKRIPEAQRSGLDLSCWETAFAGAEPVRHATMERFAATFAACGFRERALFPCYGLAEASLFVTGTGVLRGATSSRFSTKHLESHQVREIAFEGDTSSRALISCGCSWGEQVIEIVNPESGERCAPGAVGEIWVAGPHVSRGYWNDEVESERTFGARLSGREHLRFLRTGDLGFMHKGDLYIAGRMKDLIIVAGRNHDPADIEYTVCASHPAIRTGGCAAFQVEVEEQAVLAIAVELERTSGVMSKKAETLHGPPMPPMSEHEVIRAVRRAVADQHDLSVHEVVLLRPASLPRTSSGKIQRYAAKDAWQQKHLMTWAE